MYVRDNALSMIARKRRRCRRSETYRNFSRPTGTLRTLPCARNTQTQNDALKRVRPSSIETITLNDFG